MRLVVAAITGLFLSLAPLIVRGAHPPRTFPQVLLARSRTEPVVAVDPTHPSFIVAGSNTNYGTPVGDLLPDGYYWSTNRGATFTRGDLPMVRPYTTAADPSVAVANDGTVFFASLGETPSYCSGGQSAVELTHSTDHGRGYRSPVLVDVNSADDKPLMTVESVHGGPAHIFVVWTRWHSHASDIWFARSLDGGAHFTTARMLYSSSLDNFGPTPVVGPGGRVYVFWTTFDEFSLNSTLPAFIQMRVSSDDGRHFATVRHVTPSFTALPPLEQPGSLRNLPGPAATVTRDGTVYLAWSQVSHQSGSDEADIEVAHSGDGGASWSPALRANDRRVGDRFMPALTAWPDGSVGVAFYDRRNGWNDLAVYATRLYATGTRRIPNRRVSALPSPVSSIYYIAPGSTCLEPGRFFGDYIGAAALPRHVLAVTWADAHLRTPDQTDLWFRKMAF